MADGLDDRLAWTAALTLAERMALAAAGIGPADAAQAADHLRRWQAQAPFDDPALFAHRTASEADPTIFAQALGLHAAQLAAAFDPVPRWLAHIEAVWSAEQPSAFALPSDHHDPQQFLWLVAPLLSQAVTRLQAELHTLRLRHSQAPFDPATIVPILLADLPDVLIEALSRTLVLELHVARLEGLLAGTTAAERFQSFVSRLRDPAIAHSILQEYPVLARHVATQIDRWITVMLLSLEHLCADWHALGAAFAPAEAPGVLRHVATSGDQHSGGRAVLVLTFRSGWRVVYKPRSLQSDVAFQALLGWINQQQCVPALRCLQVLDCGDHGWVEFVEAAPCHSQAEIERFYLRQGAYLALLYVLQATDFHAENLIAAGEQPVLIDLESLFHPYLTTNQTPELAELSQMLGSSVLRVGLLPQPSSAVAGIAKLDLSGLGGAPGQRLPGKQPTINGAAPDELRVVRQEMTLVARANRPSLDGTTPALIQFTPWIEQGFRAIYEVLREHQAALLAPGGPLARFGSAELRVIVRPTRTYAVLLQESLHPDLLREALDRDRFFDQLWRPARDLPQIMPLIRAERADLWQGDIPIFTTQASSRNLWSSGRECWPDFFAASGLERTTAALAQLGPRDLARQLWLIRAACATLLPPSDPHQAQARPALTPVVAPDALTAACAIADRLALLAAHNQSGSLVQWFGLALVSEEQWALAPLGPDLYNGLSGVALFLAQLGAISGEPRYTELAHASLATLRHVLTLHGSGLVSIGGFSGWGSVIYLLTHLGVLWNAPDLLAEAHALVPQIIKHLAADQQFDILGGAAGAICVLLGLHRVTQHEATLAAAVACGEHLVAHAQPQAHGIGWAAPDQPALAGWSHGVAGIAAALFDLAAAADNHHFAHTAETALSYERSLFVEAQGNWRDLRSQPAALGAAAEPVFWCHGAPGIGLGRLRSLAVQDTPTVRREIATALRTTLAHGFDLNHGLCHGALGNLELLLQARATLSPAPELPINELVAQILASASVAGWQCGLPAPVETPGLMLGLAGIGYGLLRTHAPDRVPSVLTLAGPRRTV